MDPIRYSQEMLFLGTKELTDAKILKESVTFQEAMLAVTKIYRAMKAAEPQIIKPKDIFRGNL